MRVISIAQPIDPDQFVAECEAAGLAEARSKNFLTVVRDWKTATVQLRDEADTEQVTALHALIDAHVPSRMRLVVAGSGKDPNQLHDEILALDPEARLESNESEILLTIRSAAASAATAAIAAHKPRPKPPPPDLRAHSRAIRDAQTLPQLRLALADYLSAIHGPIGI